MKFIALILAVSARVADSFHQFPLIPHHAHIQRQSGAGRDESLHHERRHHGRRLNAQQVDAAYQGYGTHYVDIWTGTPPQRQTVIIGTGSGGIGFPCSNCLDCGDGSAHTDKFFREADSFTFRPITCGNCEVGHCQAQEVSNGKCQYGISYQEGSSWSGFEAKDMAYVGGPHDKALAKGAGDGEAHDDIDPDQAREYQFELDFICQTTATGLFQTQLADGILGMDNSPHSYWSQAVRANISETPAFSLCFARQPTASRTGTEAGAFTLGGFDQRLHDADSPVVFAKLLEDKSEFFRVDLKGIWLRKGGGGESALSTNSSVPIVELEITEAELNDGGVVIDSGTTDTYLPRHFAKDFLKVWETMTTIPYDYFPKKLTEEKLLELPTILFQLQGDTAANKNADTKDGVKYPLGTLGSAVPDDGRAEKDQYDVIVAMPPSHYMEYNSVEKTYTNRLYMEEAWGSTLGANFMMGHDLTFDTKKMTLGWAESDCDYLGVLDQFDEPNPWENPGSDKNTIPSGGGAGGGDNNNGGGGSSSGSGSSTDASTSTYTSDSETKKSRGSSLGKAVLSLFVLTGALVAGAFYGKRFYERRVGIVRYQATSIENELELQVSAPDEKQGSYSSPAFSIT